MTADVLGVFVKAPVVGRVKTRLAADLGARQAARLYRQLGRTVIANCARPASYRTVVWFAPRERGVTVRSWLDDLAVDAFLPQQGDDLGARLIAAFDEHFRAGAKRVTIIGSDCPDVADPLVRRAFAALRRADAVIGPTLDGGYYLIALKRPAPGLFRAIAWSTTDVLAMTLARARRLRLHIALLPTLRDVDTAHDARALGLVSS
jgi:rSAM/selenodomain-associated transferase 1